MGNVFSDAFVVQGVAALVSNDDPAGIGALWQALWAKDLPNTIADKLSDEIVCVYHDYRGTHVDPFVMTIGLRVTATAPRIEGLSTVNVPAQQMATFDATGPQPDSLVAQWGHIWGTPLARTYVADYDVYDSANPERVTVYVGIDAS